MKAYKIELLIEDHDEIGIDQIIDVIENARYPNRCISPEVIGVMESDIGEWHDDHPLNLMSERYDYINKIEWQEVDEK